MAATSCALLVPTHGVFPLLETRQRLPSDLSSYRTVCVRWLDPPDAAFVDASRAIAERTARRINRAGTFQAFVGREHDECPAHLDLRMRLMQMRQLRGPVHVMAEVSLVANSDGQVLGSAAIGASTDRDRPSGTQDGALTVTANAIGDFLLGSK